ncbi:hypothetical protein FACS1894147_11770 [Spirochaetia bacterium]|nr:hypothetical protein FACS1894147_11770 [Spirochaetia bacterium]
MMKRSVPGGLLGLIIFIAFFSGCAGAPKNRGEEKPPDVRPEPLYRKDFSGEGSFIVVERPEGGELGEDDEYLLDIIKGVLAEDIGKFSKINVVDEVIPEDALSTGRLYVLSGTLTGVSNGYDLELGFSDAGTGEGEAGFRRHFTAGELKSGALKAASRYCLAALGVQLTAAGEKALDAFASANAESQVFLARGKAARERGNLVEELVYNYSAFSLNPRLEKAPARPPEEINDVEHRN